VEKQGTVRCYFFIIGTFFAHSVYLPFRKRYWAEHPKNIEGGEMDPPDFGWIQKSELPV